MTKRKSKSGNKLHHEDTSVLLESPATQSRGLNEYVLPGLLFLILAVGGSTVGWFCLQQQYTLDQLSESYTAMQMRITKFQQVMGMRDAQGNASQVIEDRIMALEEAQKQAQQKAEVALATSEKLKNTDLHTQVWALHSEMDTRLAEMQQVAVSAAVLQAMLKNKTEEFEAVKETVVAILNSNSALAASVAGLTSAVASTTSRLDEQLTTIDSLDAQLEGQASELNEMKVSLDLHKVALYTNNQEVSAIKELLEAEHAMRALALEEKLSSVKQTLDEQLFSSQILHSNIKAQLENVHSQLLNGGQPGSEPVEVQSDEEEEAPIAEDTISAAEEEEATEEEEPEHVEEEADEQNAEEEVVDEVEEEEEVEEESTQDELPHEQEVEEEVIEEPREEEITEQSEENNIAEEATEEEVTEDIVVGDVGDVLEESLEEEDSEDTVEEDIVVEEEEEEEPAELESDILEEEEDV